MQPQMQEKIKIPFFVPLMNPFIRTMLRLGAPMGPMTLLTVRGRKSGKARTTPVAMMEAGGHRYLLGTFGNVDWVRNLRVSKDAKVGRGRKRETVHARELPVSEKTAVFQQVLSPFLASRAMTSFLSMGYELNSNSTEEDYLREATRHPAFEIFP